MQLIELLKFSKDSGASDVHISVGSSPGLRIDGRIVKIKGKQLSADQARRLCYSVLNDQQKANLEKDRELDFSFEIQGVARFRANYCFAKNVLSGFYRRIPTEIPSIGSLGLPEIVRTFSNFPNGLVLVTGPTGSGKTTTIASILSIINKRKYGHILTIEDPIEYIHEHRRCIVTQREVGYDSKSFLSALKVAMRQDPDYCLIGEMRDLEVIEVALRMAETGHLVFSTLHTNSAIQTVNRIINVFPESQKDRVRTLLSFTLQAVISQRLIPSLKGGRVLAYEILIMTPAIRNLIRENKLHQIETMMQIGQKKSSMITLNQNLLKLYLEGKITKDQAVSNSTDIEAMVSLLKKEDL